MDEKNTYLKGRGAQINTANPYHNLVYDQTPIDWSMAEEDHPSLRTEFIKVHPKTMLNKVTSPDIPANFSINPYQGCEHGCVYCYARNTHPYWGYSAGLDFEQKILVKQNAAALLEKKLQHKKWKATPLMMSGNTDCYQPAEKDMKITRSLLEVLWKYRHPVGIITKNSLVMRDLDLLKKLNEHNLVHVTLSITTLDEKLRMLLEPRTATIQSRLRTLEKLSAGGIPCNVMMAPIIPGLNDHEIFQMVKTVADLGARAVGYTMVRLNGDVAEIFTDWIRKTMPDRADKVLNKIKECHGGSLSDNRFGKRMSGEGNIAKIISKQFRVAKERYLKDRTTPPYNCEIHEDFKSPQLKLF